MKSNAASILGKVGALSAVVVSAVIMTASRTRASEQDVTPVWPASNLARFVFAHLDITSFRNSTAPRRKPGQRYFGDLGIRPDHVTETNAASSSDDWSYVVRILGRGDYNRDGVQDVAICLSDGATGGGTYDTSSAYLVELIGERAVAVAYGIDDLPAAKDCQRTPEASR